jgi:hypothetical protein
MDSEYRKSVMYFPLRFIRAALSTGNPVTSYRSHAPINVTEGISAMQKGPSLQPESFPPDT